jgi:hypothetical protein
MKFDLRHHGISVFAVPVAAFALTGGIAYATIPDSGGVIHGCQNSGAGGLRVIDTELGQQCLSQELPLEWNQQGPQGPAGSQGPAGPQGPAGVSGLERVAVMSAINSDNFKEVVADCPAGKTVTGGGYFIGGAFGEVLAQRSEPRLTPTGWLVTVVEIGMGRTRSGSSSLRRSAPTRRRQGGGEARSGSGRGGLGQHALT